MYTDNEKSRRAAEVRDCGSGIAGFFGFRRAESRKRGRKSPGGGAEPSGNVPAQNSISGQHTGYGIIKRKHPTARFVGCLLFESVFHRFRRRRTLSPPCRASVAGTRSGSFQTPALCKLGAEKRHDLLFLSRHLDLRQPEIVRDLLLGHIAVIPEQDDLLPERLHFSDRLRERNTIAGCVPFRSLPRP